MSLSHDDAYKIIIIVSVSLKLFTVHFKNSLLLNFTKNCGKQYINLRNIEYFRNVKQLNFNEKKIWSCSCKFRKYLKAI